MDQKTLTISVAAYNAEKYINKCLNSFIETDVRDKLEVLVVDDGSSDNTGDIVKEYEKRYPEIIRLISKENGGHGSTINRGILEATGRYFKIVDSDDWVEKEGLENLVYNLENTDVELVLNPYYEVSAKSGSKELRNYYDISDDDTSSFTPVGTTTEFRKVCDKIYFAMHEMTYRTDILKGMGAFIDEHCFYVDSEFILFPLKHVETVVLLENPVYDYLLGTDFQSMNSTMMIKRREQHLKVCKRLVDFYSGELGDVNSKVKMAIRRRLNGFVATQYIIYLWMKPNESKRDIVDFDTYVRKQSPELYNCLCEDNNGSGYMKLVRVLRKCGFIMFVPIVSALKLLGIVK